MGRAENSPAGINPYKSRAGQDSNLCNRALNISTLYRNTLIPPAHKPRWCRHSQGNSLYAKNL